jgi:uncharacterized protein (DUF952 family)
MYVYHIVLPADWENWKDKTFYEAASLETEGFIHCSFEDQVAGVIGRYSKDAGEVVVLKIDTGKLISKLVAEPSTNNELYPHIYGPINLDAFAQAELRKVSDILA